MSGRDTLRAQESARDNGRPQSFTLDKQLKLPPVPPLDDVPGLCLWLTCALNLDRQHAIHGGRRCGLRGPSGRAELFRVEAPPIIFEPVSRINTPLRLIENLTWATIPTDGPVPAYKGEHCRLIAHAVRLLCGAYETLSEEQETGGIVSTFLQYAIEIDATKPVTTYGSTAERHDVAVALRRDEFGHPRYARDANTGEYLIAVNELQDAARRYIGSSRPHGWLDGRMEAFGWRRVTVSGYDKAPDGGRGKHARIDVYRGLLTVHDQEVVHT